MKKRFYPYLIASLMCMLVVAPLHAQQQMDQFNYKGKLLNYTVILPLDFDPAKTYPVLVGPSDAETIKDESFYWQGIKDSQGWILIGYRIFGALNRIDEVETLFKHLNKKYMVEGDKFHTVCFSANSAGIFDLVMELPDYFASITGMAGNPNNGNKEKLKKLQGVKVQFVVGDKDPYWMKNAKRSHQLLLDVGVESTIEIIKNGQHVMRPLIGKGFLDRVDRLR